MCFLWPKHYTRHLRNVFLSNNKYKLLINCIVKLQIFDFTKKNFSFKIYLKGNVIMLSLKLNISFSHGIFFLTNKHILDSMHIFPRWVSRRTIFYFPFLILSFILHYLRLFLCWNQPSKNEIFLKKLTRVKTVQDS